MSHLEEIARRLVQGEAEAVERLVRRALEEGIPPDAILEGGLIPGMRVVGRLFRENEIFVPEVLLSARAMKAGLGHLEPLFAASGVEPRGTFVIGTVKGDIHDIGKNLVAVMLRGAGFRVVDLGVDVPARRFVEAVREHRPEIVGMSALLTTTMGRMAENVEAIRAASRGVRIMVGGAPVTEAFAREIGADGYGENAAEAVDGALALLGRGPPPGGAGGPGTRAPEASSP